ncbi:MAG: 50S ribosomal protein L9 [Bacteroidetes bacterium MED-G17]|nr:MAG: 50S ribosomal protein L9 [Bacteroidetes bacterium TMED39]PDH52550.1 MAG: 50S ribosomal protein L9 [Bacteroidetes bacterium MED-G17]CAI8275127.1 MAG: 50S ribosomal protein L9 [Bacteroidetes bacterium MED-G17]|tara:strand:+ start:18275 stop:18721 length:447 start_codon:yes stop_codon:yes gene_type:complete
MKLILKKDVAKLGEKDQVVEVKDGYGRNFLIPQGKAVLATVSQLKMLEETKKQRVAKEKELVSNARKLADELEGREVGIEVKAGSNGKIFGSITTMQIAVKLADMGYEIDRKSIELKEEIKQLGSYTAMLNLHKSVNAQINLEVIQED